MTEQWGAPLTGAQMKLLRAAGLKGRGWQGHQHYLVEYHTFSDNVDDYRLPANHQAYTLAKAGWLDGRNVRLWFGGDKAPDDWDGGDVLVNDTHPRIVKGDVIDQHNWSGNKQRAEIIAYIAKNEAVLMEVTADAIDPSKVPPVYHVTPQPDTVTIAKMTREEWDKLRHANLSLEAWAIRNGLIREPTIEERFWAMHEPEGTTVPTHIKKWVKDALEFER